MSNKLSLLVSLWIKDGNIAGFEAFERKAAVIMAKYGGKIERVVRIENPSAEMPFEVHLVSFPDAQAFAAYRADPASAALAEMRQQVIERTLVWSGEEIESYTVS